MGAMWLANLLFQMYFQNGFKDLDWDQPENERIKNKLFWIVSDLKKLLSFSWSQMFSFGDYNFCSVYFFPCLKQFGEAYTS